MMGCWFWGRGGGGTSRLKVWPTWGSGCLAEFVGQLREAENNLVMEQELERSGVCTEVDEAPGVVGMPKVYRRRLLQPTGWEEGRVDRKGCLVKLAKWIASWWSNATALLCSGLDSCAMQWTGRFYVCHTLWGVGEPGGE